MKKRTPNRRLYFARLKPSIKPSSASMKATYEFFPSVFQSSSSIKSKSSVDRFSVFRTLLLQSIVFQIYKKTDRDFPTLPTLVDFFCHSGDCVPVNLYKPHHCLASAWLKTGLNQKSKLQGPISKGEKLYNLYFRHSTTSSSHFL